MSRELLVFVRASGFLAGCYRGFLHGLQPHYRAPAPGAYNETDPPEEEDTP